MSRNFKPEYAVNQRLKDKQKPMYIGGLKIPTPANSSFQCWCVTGFTLIGYHCYFTNFPINTNTASNILGIVLCSITLYSLWMTWSTPAGTIPDKGWVRLISVLLPSACCFPYFYRCSTRLHFLVHVTAMVLCIYIASEGQKRRFVGKVCSFRLSYRISHFSAIPNAKIVSRSQLESKNLPKEI